MVRDCPLPFGDNFVRQERAHGGRPTESCRAPGYFRPALRAAAVLLCIVGAARADAQTATATEIEKSVPSGMSILADPREIVVTAPRGAALVEPETELDEERIGAYGASSIRELIRDLAPLIGGADDPPALLVNGKRVGDAAGIEGFPPEALSRLAILPPEAAARYGFPANRRVVNLVLKPHFVSWTLGSGLTFPTAGGRDGETLSASRVAIDGSTYWNASVRLARESRLLRSERLPQFDDEDRFKSLFPSSRSIDVNAGITHPIGDFSGSLSLNASVNGSRGLLGRDDARTLQDRQDSKSLGLSMTFSGPIGDVRTSLAASYARSWTKSLFERKASLQGDRSNSTSESWNLQLYVDTVIATLPAGPLTSNFTIGGNRSTLLSRHGDGYADALRRDQLTTQLSLAMPITSRDAGFLGGLGNIAVDFAGGIDIASEEKRRLRYTAGLGWSPVPALDLRGSMTFSETVLPIALLNAPRVETIMRIYDYARQETAELIGIFGGNPDLRGGSQRTLSLRATLRPFGNQLATFTTDYQRQVGRGGITSFPQLTPAVERVFAGRIVRGADGRLVSIDARPIPIERDLSSRLNNSLTLFFSHNPKPAEGGVTKARISGRSQVTVSIIHGWQLRSELLTAPGLPVFDRLGGDGGQSRHTLSLMVNAGWQGLGASLNGNWQSGVRVRDATRPDGQGDFLYPATAQFNVGLFVEPEHLRRGSGEKSWLSKLRISLDVQNLLNTYRRVRLSDGSIPAGYRRYEIDPLGRSIQISIQKQF